jgi:hypothetical protein
MSTTTANDVRDLLVAAIAAAAVLDPEIQIGSYTYPDGAVQPAVFVGHEPPAGVEVAGIELIVLRDPKRKLISNFAGTINLLYWQIIVKSWSDEPLLPVLNVIGRLKGISRPELRPATSDTIAMATFSLLLD